MYALKILEIVIWDSRFFDNVAFRMWISFFGVKIRFLVRFRILISLLTPKNTEIKKKSTKLTFLASVKSECGRGHVRLNIRFKSGRQ